MSADFRRRRSVRRDPCPHRYRDLRPARHQRELALIRFRRQRCKRSPARQQASRAARSCRDSATQPSVGPKSGAGDVQKDGAAESRRHRRVVMADDDDEVVKAVVAPQPLMTGGGRASAPAGCRRHRPDRRTSRRSGSIAGTGNAVCGTGSAGPGGTARVARETGRAGVAPSPSRLSARKPPRPSGAAARAGLATRQHDRRRKTKISMALARSAPDPL